MWPWPAPAVSRPSRMSTATAARREWGSGRAGLRRGAEAAASRPREGAGWAPSCRGGAGGWGEGSERGSGEVGFFSKCWKKERVSCGKHGEMFRVTLSAPFLFV